MATPTTTTKAASHMAAHARHTLLPDWVTHLGGLGLFVIAILDSSPIPLPIPGSVDLLLLLLVAHRGNPFLLAPCAIVGSAIGGYTTWSAGKKGGETLLRRSIPARFQERVQNWAKSHSVLSVFIPAILPPPIALMPFLLASGAIGVPRNRFLVALTAARTIRYGLIAWAGVAYGRKVVGWWTRNLSEWSGAIGWTFAVLLVGAVGYGIWKYWRQKRSESAERAFASSRIPSEATRLQP